MPAEFRPSMMFKGLGVATMIMPWLGIAARLLTPKPLDLVATGLILWILGSAIFWFLHRSSRGAKKSWTFASSFLVWTFTFVALYCASSFATGFFLQKR